jgi:phosphoglycerate kinase
MSARKAFIGHIDPLRFHQKHVLIRVDYNVPLKVPKKEINEAKIEVASDARIIDSLPTLKFFLASEAKIVLCSHLGRPKNGIDSQLSLRPVADYLKRLLGDINVEFLPDCIGSEVKQTICNQPPGSIILLENLRFHQEEITNDEGFAKELADGMDVYVNEAFSVCHRGRKFVSFLLSLFI